MITEIWAAGKKIEMYADAKIRHTFQVNDIAEVKDRQASFTNSFSIPRTPRNVQIFEGLGISSDTSRLPYQKPSCQVKLDGFDLIVKGWLNVKETTETEYKIYIYSGIIEFFKAIENKSIGKDLDLSEIDHVKDLSTVVASFTNDNYRYLIADYNGKTHFGDNLDKINIDFLNPSVSVKYLWNKIHETFGFTYLGSVFETTDFTNWWLTYPKATLGEQTMTPIAEIHFNKTMAQVRMTAVDNQYHFFVSDNVPKLDEGDVLEYGVSFNQHLPNLKGYYRFASSGVFRIKITGTVSTRKTNFANVIKYLSVIRNAANQSPAQCVPPFGVKVWQDKSENINISYELTDFFHSGDTVGLGFFHMLTDNEFSADATMEISKNISENIQFSEELAELSITDFVKEVYNHFALTAFTDEFSNQVDYLTVKERFNPAEVVDWSGKYIQRIQESYTDQSYAKENIFAYEYNDKEASHNNGSFLIDNLNLPESKILFKSKTYSPDKEVTKFKLNTTDFRFSPVFRIWEKEPNDDGTLKYKGLSRRYYFMRVEQVNVNAIIGSLITKEEKPVSNLPFATFADLDWKVLISKYYTPFFNVVNDSKVHTININLNHIDILQLNLKKLYYFRQEQQYYFLNKLNFDEDKASGEFVRVSMPEPNIAVTTPPTNPTPNPQTQVAPHAFSPSIIVPGNISNPTNTGTSPSTICFTGNAWTKSIHLDKPAPGVGATIYLPDGVTKAIPGNISSLDTVGTKYNLYGIRWIRFSGINNIIYEVDPATAIIVRESAFTC